MKKTVDITKEINDIRKLPANKKCFECGEIGTTYIVPDFGVFVCSICAGIHREFNHRVKGLSMSNFAQQELDLLRLQGNEVCQRTWLARYNPRDLPQPSPKETQRIKDFIRLKYKERRWYQDLSQEAGASQVQAEIRESAPVMLPKPAAAAAAPVPQLTQASDLLSLGEPPARPAAPSSEGWADFAPATNQVNIQISFQQPKAEDRKQSEAPQTGIQVRQVPSYPESQPSVPKETYQAAPPQPNFFQSAFPQTYQQAAAPPSFPPAQVPEKVPVAAPMAVAPQTPAYVPQPPQYAYPTQMQYPPQQTYPMYTSAVPSMHSDPFSRLVDADLEKQAQKHAGSGGANVRLLQQQYHVQSQTYMQMYGVPYPYTFQAWCQVMFPKPVGVLTQSRGNNPFDMFG